MLRTGIRIFQLPEAAIRLASARAGNVIGGGDFAKDRIVPDFVRARKAGKALHIRRPDAVRPWQHVLEPLAGYLVLAAKLANDISFATAYNFGPETTDVLTVKALVEESEKIWPGPETIYGVELNGPHEAGLLLLDINKAKTDLGFVPRWNSFTAISETINWYKDAGNDSRSKCMEQIKRYFR